MIERFEKIKNGTIRIENGQLRGLGMNDKESIDIELLDDLVKSDGNYGCIDTLSKTIAAVAKILSITMEKDGEIREFLDEWIVPELPDHGEVYLLKKLIDVFNTYRF